MFRKKNQYQAPVSPIRIRDTGLGYGRWSVVVVRIGETERSYGSMLLIENPALSSVSLLLKMDTGLSSVSGIRILGP